MKGLREDWGLDRRDSSDARTVGGTMMSAKFAEVAETNTYTARAVHAKRMRRMPGDDVNISH